MLLVVIRCYWLLFVVILRKLFVVIEVIGLLVYCLLVYYPLPTTYYQLPTIIYFTIVTIKLVSENKMDKAEIPKDSAAPKLDELDLGLFGSTYTTSFCSR